MRFCLFQCFDVIARNCYLIIFLITFRKRSRNLRSILKVFVNQSLIFGNSPRTSKYNLKRILDFSSFRYAENVSISLLNHSSLFISTFSVLASSTFQPRNSTSAGFNATLTPSTLVSTRPPLTGKFKRIP